MKLLVWSTVIIFSHEASNDGLYNYHLETCQLTFTSQTFNRCPLKQGQEEISQNV